MIGTLQFIGMALIISLFFFDKTKNYESKLEGWYLKFFRLSKFLFEPIIKFIARYLKPMKMGQGIFIDVSHIIILFILLLIITL
jgi:hypothetical protein